MASFLQPSTRSSDFLSGRPPMTAGRAGAGGAVAVDRRRRPPAAVVIAMHPAIAVAADLAVEGATSMAKGAAVLTVARAIASQAGGWRAQHVLTRLRSLLRSEVGGVIAPTLLAVTTGMGTSLAGGWQQRALVAVACLLGAAGSLGLRLGTKKELLEGAVALPLAAAGAAVGVGSLGQLALMARAVLAT